MELKIAANGRRNAHKQVMDFYSNTGMNHISKITQVGKFGSVNADIGLVLSSSLVQKKVIDRNCY